MKISILLPYKENFSPNYAGAVSLFVKDINNQSKYKNSSYVFGNMNYKKKLSKNYVNLSLEKKFYKSASKQYVDSFLNAEKKYQSDIVEVHNRPNYIKQLKKDYNGKIILFFHNDPLTMNGSMSLTDRKYLIQNIDLIVFNSNWSKRRFFVGIINQNFYDIKTAICYQSAPKKKLILIKKKKLFHLLEK